MNRDTATTIVWTGDLDDDCTARWAGLLLRAEWMDGPDWWWAVTDLHHDIEIGSSNSDPRSCTSGNEARTRAEACAKAYLRQPS